MEKHPNLPFCPCLSEKRDRPQLTVIAAARSGSNSSAMS